MSRAAYYVGSVPAPFRWHVTRPDGSALDPSVSLALMNHSPTGFAWGYPGSGPAQLALALLLDVGLLLGLQDPDEVALEHYQTFKARTVSRWPQDGGWSLSVREVAEFLEGVGVRLVAGECPICARYPRGECRFRKPPPSLCPVSLAPWATVEDGVVTATPPEGTPPGTYPFR